MQDQILTGHLDYGEAWLHDVRLKKVGVQVSSPGISLN
jgi:hypothetical protein